MTNDQCWIIYENGVPVSYNSYNRNELLADETLKDNFIDSIVDQLKSGSRVFSTFRQKFIPTMLFETYIKQKG